MKKNSIGIQWESQIFEGKKLTIGMDLGDRSTHYCVIGEGAKCCWNECLPTTEKGHEQVFRLNVAQPDSDGDRAAFAVEPALSGLGHEVIVAHARRRAVDWGKQRKMTGWMPGCWHGWRGSIRLAEPGATSQRGSAGASDGDSGAGRVGGSAHRAGECARGLAKSYGERLRKCGTRTMRKDLAAGLSPGVARPPWSPCCRKSHR